MIKSMTGFASLTRDDEAAAIAVTVRSVNHRHLDLQLRIPAGLAASEPQLRAIVQGRLARGRVEVNVSVQPHKTSTVEVELNEPFAAALGAVLERARQQGLVEGALTPGDLLRFHQAVTVRDRAEEPGADRDAVRRLAARVEEAVAAAIDDLDTMRTREGGFLQADLDARSRQLGELYDRVAAAAAQGTDALQARLAERIRELRADSQVDDGQIAAEIVRFVGRSDITEEAVRFRGHLAHWQALTEAPEPCGRKLDFLLQEMNREVNTTASKAEGSGVSELIVTMKAELEKLREQVQNVE